MTITSQRTATKPLETSVLSEHLANVWKNLNGYECSFVHSSARKRLAASKSPQKKHTAQFKTLFPSFRLAMDPYR